MRETRGITDRRGNSCGIAPERAMVYQWYLKLCRDPGGGGDLRHDDRQASWRLSDEKNDSGHAAGEDDMKARLSSMAWARETFKTVIGSNVSDDWGSAIDRHSGMSNRGPATAGRP
jgi:hypothetical protein